METKTLAFDVRDVEQLKEFFPDFKDGKMSGRELGGKLLEIVKNQISNSEIPFIKAKEDELRRLKHDFVELQNHCNQLEAKLAEKPSDNDFQRNKRKNRVRLKRITMNFHLTI